MWHTALPQHLLSRSHRTITEAVRIAEEFLQLEKTKPSLAQIDEEPGQPKQPKAPSPGYDKDSSRQPETDDGTD